MVTIKFIATHEGQYYGSEWKLGDVDIQSPNLQETIDFVTREIVDDTKEKIFARNGMAGQGAPVRHADHMGWGGATT